MAARKSQGKDKGEGWFARWFRKPWRLVAALAGLLLAFMLADANLVRLQVVHLPLRDLPAAFEGVKILYVSDLNINGLRGPGKLNALMREICRAEPDLLLLGGDYTSFDPLLRLRALLAGESNPRRVEAQLRDEFFQALAQAQPPLGKFAVPGENDNLLERNTGLPLAQAANLGGVTLLRNQAARVTRNGQTLVIAGAEDWSTGLQETQALATQATAAECVLLLSHNPEAVPALNNRPAADGPWIDVALTGHTLGGVIRLFGRELLNPLGDDPRYRRGWHWENGVKMLVSPGVGNRMLPLRLNDGPQAHLIILTRSGS